MPGPSGLAVIRPAAYQASNGCHKCGGHIEYNAREGILRATPWRVRLDWLVSCGIYTAGGGYLYLLGGAYLARR